MHIIELLKEKRNKIMTEEIEGTQLFKHYMKIRSELRYLEDITLSLQDDVKSLRNMINANYKDFANYAEHNPKSSDQWTEERLRALELQVKELRECQK